MNPLLKIDFERMIAYWKCNTLKIHLKAEHSFPLRLMVIVLIWKAGETYSVSFTALGKSFRTYFVYAYLLSKRIFFKLLAQGVGGKVFAAGVASVWRSQGLSRAAYSQFKMALQQTHPRSQLSLSATLVVPL